MVALLAKSAEIATAIVEIKALTVSGRQVTLAMYRQIPERTIFNIDGSLNGTPWGRVNVHDKSCKGDNHLHILWETKGVLFKAAVDIWRHSKTMHCPGHDDRICQQDRECKSVAECEGRAERRMSNIRLLAQTPQLYIAT
jgi:hypothetical protein